MTQEFLTAYEIDETNSADTNDTNDENDTDDESKKQIEAIVAGDKDEFDTVLNDTIDAIEINPDAPELDKIPSMTR